MASAGLWESRVDPLDVQTMAAYIIGESAHHQYA
jgi:hypothetical protein